MSAADGVRRRQQAKPPQDMAEAAARWIADVDDALNGAGRHAGHRLSQAGRCVCCSCGLRWQGRLSARKGKG